MKTRLPPTEVGWYAYSYHLLSDGALGVFETDSDIRGAFRDWFAAAKENPKTKPMPNPWKGKARLQIVSENGGFETVTLPLVPHPLIDRFADGRILVASSRARGQDRNAALYSSTGRRLRDFVLGDGIEHLLCSPDGTIWVGYFDEGVFGDSVGTGGLVRFDDTGIVKWNYNARWRETGRSIADCYALTLAGRDVWSCYYTDFPVILVSDGKESYWTNNEIGGASALAVSDRLVVLAGGYSKEKTRIALIKLSADSVKRVGAINRPQLASAELLQGRSDTLHFVVDHEWHRLTVREIETEIRR